MYTLRSCDKSCCASCIIVTVAHNHHSYNDLNCDNLLSIKENPLKLSGVIDITDTNITHSVFDGAICIAHLMMNDCTNPFGIYHTPCIWVL